MKKGTGIRFQLIAGMVVMTIAGIGLIGVLSIKIVERSALMWKIGQASSTAAFARATYAATSGAAREADPRAFETFMKAAGASGFALTSHDGRVALSSGSVPAGGGELIYEDESIRAYRYGGGFFNGIGDAIRVATAMPGGVRLEFTQSLADINEDMAGVRRFLAVYAALDSIIIIAFGVYFLSRSIVRPLKKLEEAATRIAGGKLYERAEVAVDNEVGSVAASFNSMAGRLEDEIKSLERVNLELTTTQEELLRNSTLAAVGRLAAGIAHEIGNPLGALGGYMELVSRGGLDPEEQKDIVARASREIDRIDAIVREFLEVARPARVSIEPVDVGAVLIDALSAISVRSEFIGVETSFDPPGGLPPVMADEGKLRQVFMNILINAAQAMDGAPRKSLSITAGAATRPATVKTGRRKDDPPPVTQHERGLVRVTFRDTGGGIGAGDAARIFEPFFTTKDVGKGTGLGLFVSQSIIKAYGGEITFRNTVEGAEFTVTLPAGDALS